MFLSKKASALTQEQAEHLKQTFALLGTGSETDAKLDELRQFVRDYQVSLSARRGTTS